MVNVGKYGSIIFYQSPLIYSGLSPPATMANEGLVWDPLSKNIIILVVTVAGQGDNPKYTIFYQDFLSRTSLLATYTRATPKNTPVTPP